MNHFSNCIDVRIRDSEIVNFLMFAWQHDMRFVQYWILNSIFKTFIILVEKNLIVKNSHKDLSQHKQHEYQESSVT